MKRDPYKRKEEWERRKKNIKQELKPFGKKNSDLIITFLNDMEKGLNTPQGSKGPRGPATLLNLLTHISFFPKHMKGDIVKYTKEELHDLTDKVLKKKIKRMNGKDFIGFENYLKGFKTFWGWLIRTDRVSKSITEDISIKRRKPNWVYLSEDQFKKLANRCNPDYKALVWFMYDAGLRVTESYSIKIKDFDHDFTELTIGEDVAKTFGRVIKLKLSVGLIKEFVKFHNLGPNDFLFNKKPPAMNKYLKTLSKKLFGDGESKARETYDKFTAYDIRHNASCYWLKRYPNLRGLKYRMGWKKEEMATYYHEFLGLSDEIKDEDMVLSEDKSKLEREHEKMRGEMELIKKAMARFMKGEPVKASPPLVEAFISD